MSKKVISIEFFLATISLWLVFSLQKVNINGIYLLFYLPLMFAIYWVLKRPLLNGRLLNRYISYSLALLLALLTFLKVALDNNISIKGIVLMEGLLSVIGMTIIFEKLFQITIQFSFTNNIISDSHGITWKTSFWIILIGWIIYLLPFLPGNIAGDANYQLSQYFKYTPMTNHHPFLSTIFEGGVFNLGKHFLGDNFGLFLYVFIQLLICAIIYSFCISRISRLGINSKLAVIFSLFIGFAPYWSFASETLHKDGMFLAFFALYISSLIIIVSKYVLIGTGNINKKYLVELIITGLLVSFWRNDGIYMVIPPILCLVFIEKHKYYKQFTIVLLVTLLIYMGFNKIALPVLHVAPTEESEALSLPAQQTARYLRNYPNDVTVKEKKSLAEIFNNSNRLGELYNPNISDPVKYHIRHDASLKKYIRVWMEMGIRHPLVYINATFAGTNNYYVPWSIAQDFTWCGEISKIFKPSFLHMHYITSSRVRYIFTKIVSKVATIPFINVFLSSAVAVWICLLMGVVLWYRYGFKYLIPIIPIFMNLMVCIASPVNGLVRYSGCIVFATYLLVCYYFYILKNGEEKLGRNN